MVHFTKILAVTCFAATFQCSNNGVLSKSYDMNKKNLNNVGFRNNRILSSKENREEPGTSGTTSGANGNKANIPDLDNFINQTTSSCGNLGNLLAPLLKGIKSNLFSKYVNEDGTTKPNAPTAQSLTSIVKGVMHDIKPQMEALKEGIKKNIEEEGEESIKKDCDALKDGFKNIMKSFGGDFSNTVQGATGIPGKLFKGFLNEDESKTTENADIKDEIDILLEDDNTDDDDDDDGDDDDDNNDDDDDEKEKEKEKENEKGKGKGKGKKKENKETSDDNNKNAGTSTLRGKKKKF
ncbi:hypothetical protein CYL21_5190 [Plasmodium falciparum NF54]|uniref:Uncharacterized protein n=2 Tax=Plasmodium falciparum TaxID=5833 RepID=Q8IBF3_PLAF7|nr:Plasmodium exported protein, unknown function [Plasmodium falciparum 3D7]EWC89261.1 hypothetical protein PFNF54_01965 [Plasmodium falciparum NF54]KAF4326874.1 hypothetical protein CYL21_5190 [Plasmodium falciparum NF54]PKC42295.1 hypothetical protein CK202_5538 [Plasmodium falciparum NF54]CAD51049.1 Plasmodium exported protein, unknown function [Plasmodium falciparum 3D7]|eukprot:XP_001349202.1 Plasmodium exported protein, unknown function [Plasmodium falciparum 3D7]